MLTCELQLIEPTINKMRLKIFKRFESVYWIVKFLAKLLQMVSCDGASKLTPHLNPIFRNCCWQLSMREKWALAPQAATISTRQGSVNNNISMLLLDTCMISLRDTDQPIMRREWITRGHAAEINGIYLSILSCWSRICSLILSNESYIIDIDE